MQIICPTYDAGWKNSPRIERVGRRLGVMGGTFDPIHHGHLVAAEEAFWQFELDEVVFVPAGRPWMKAQREDIAGPEYRYEMVSIATSTNGHFAASRMEIEREGPTHTIDTLRALRDEGEEDVYFVTGADAILELEEWKDYREALDMAHFIAATRPGYELASAADRDGVSVMNVPALAISSSDIRRRLREGRPIRYLVPDDVIAYIEKEGLYR
jgi:nicotinate-nucleotide adenylyltransferase